jgi:hypothetical protein
MVAGAVQVGRGMVAGAVEVVSFDLVVLMHVELLSALRVLKVRLDLGALILRSFPLVCHCLPPVGRGLIASHKTEDRRESSIDG